MTITDLYSPLELKRGPAFKSKILLAPLTNQQSHDDGTASNADFSWYERIAEGGYGMVITCSTYVQPAGQRFPRQLGIYDDLHLPGLSRIAKSIERTGTPAFVQLHHAGMRGINGVPLAPSDDIKHGARAMSVEEIQWLENDFVQAALRAQKAGFNGVEIHGAFGFIFSQFLSPTLNRRTDAYGGDLQRRSKLLFDVIHAIRRQTPPGFQIGLRLSMENYGLVLDEIVEVAGEAMRIGDIDYLDIAPWDIEKRTDIPHHHNARILDLFTRLPRYGVRVGASGKIMDAEKMLRAVELGCDFIRVGRAAVLDANFPIHVKENIGYVAPSLPVTPQYLTHQGLSEHYINYMREWEGFVAD